MSKLPVILAGSLLAALTQLAFAQTGMTTTNSSDPAYTDQSRLNQTKDPYIKKRVATKKARDEYKSDKAAAKEQYKDEKADAKAEYKAAKKDAKETRKEELKENGR
ncbi:MAG TPA: hypothetical protein VL528_04365 [Oxalicibacterium sp.]|jgi:hypothetical protein|nr:hypothetical protein [Oxalicibacterium sp.]